MGKFIYLFLGILISFGFLTDLKAEDPVVYDNSDQCSAGRAFNYQTGRCEPVQNMGRVTVTGRRELQNNNKTEEEYEEERIYQSQQEANDKENGYQSSAQQQTPECSTAYTEAKKACTQMNEVGFALMIKQMFSKANQVGGGANSRASCAIQGLQGSTSLGSTAIAGWHCTKKASACLSSCSDTNSKTEKAKHEECDQMDTSVKMAIASTGLDLTGIINQATNCDKGLANNTNLPQYTPPPLPTTDLNSGSTGTPTGSGAYTGLGDEDDYGPTFDGYASNKQGSSKAEATENAGGGGGPQAGAYPGGAPNNQAQAGGSGNGPFKDPDRGFNSGGGGFSVSGVPTSAGGGGYGRNSASEKDGIDWSKFLPGGEMDPSKRSLASAEGQLASKGITGANDLTNFEKVTRMMNKKRALLKP